MASWIGRGPDKVSFSAVNNSNKPQTGIMFSLSDQHVSALAKHKAMNSLPMKILFFPFVGISTNYNLPIRLYKNSTRTIWIIAIKCLTQQARASSVKWKITTRPTHSMFLHSLIKKQYKTKKINKQKINK